MFEKYTAKARRVVFYARYAVSQIGASAIGPEHLLLGLLREDGALFSRLLPAHVSTDWMRRQLEARAEKGPRIPTSLEVPLSDAAQRALAHAAEESESLSHEQIGTEHILLGLLREESSLAAQVLRESGIDSPGVRRHLEGGGGGL